MRKIFNDNILRLYLKILPVQIFLVIASGLSGIVNGLIIGNLLDSSSMIALGLTNPWVGILSGVASIISGGAGILCGKYMGTGETEKINKAFSTSMIFAVFIGLLLSLGCFAGAAPLAKILGATPEVMNETILIIRGLSLGIIPMLMIPCFMTFLQMCNKGQISLAATILLSVFNAIFCLSAVKGFQSGILGVGIATSLSRFATVLFMAIYLLIQKDLVRFEINGMDRSILKDILIYGSPASLATILYSTRNIFINIYALDIGGVVAGKALAILGSCGCFYDCINVGVGSSLTMLASMFVGERDSNSIKKVMKITIIVGEILCVLKIVVSFFWGENIAILFGAKGAEINESYRLLNWYAWSAPFNIWTLTFMGVYQSLGRVVFCNILYPLNCILVPLFCCAVLAKSMGTDGIWILYALAEVVTLCVMYANACIRKKGLAKNFDDMLYLDSSFDTASKLSFTIYNDEDVVHVSQKVQQFCLDSGIDKKRSMISGLCMEEMAGNVVDHGFVKDKKEHSVDAFVVVEDDEAMLRLRDNCVPFDPKARLAMTPPDDPLKNIGIRMVSQLAKSMNYQKTFGMNVLTIRL